MRHWWHSYFGHPWGPWLFHEAFDRDEVVRHCRCGAEERVRSADYFVGSASASITD